MSRNSQPLPTIPCSCGSAAGQDARLRRAGDGRHDLVERPSPARSRQLLRAEARCAQQLAGQADGVDQDERLQFHPAKGLIGNV